MRDTKYLLLRGRSWYVNVKIPAELRAHYGRTHERRALHTRSLDEANRHKLLHVAAIQREFAKTAGGAGATDADMAAARELREDLKRLRGAGREYEAETLELVITDQAERLLQKTGDEGKAKAWARAALTTEDTLDELAQQWRGTMQGTKQTVDQNTNAYRTLREHLRGDYPPAHVTFEVAADFVERWLAKESEYAYNTARRKLNALIAFWDWMGRRGKVARGFNPWRGFRLNRREMQPGTKKRAYTDAELLALFGADPVYRGLPEVIVLGLLTGARLDELCSLTKAHVRAAGGALHVAFADTKTDAGDRTIAVAHPLALRVLNARLKRAKEPSARLFPEFVPGGPDGKFSWHVSKAFGRFRDALSLTRATDFHSFRRTLAERLENTRGLDIVAINRYMGWEIEGSMLATYSGGPTERTQREVARTIRLPAKVERAAAAFLARAEKRAAAPQGKRAA